MSDTFLRIIPGDPYYIPDEGSQEKARDVIQDALKTAEVVIETTPEVEFIDQGENFENVFCNVCGQEIEIGTWQEAMDLCYETRFSKLIFRTPCCSTETSLNDLKYNWPAGFSRFCISIQNPPSALDEDALNVLQTILGSPLRLIWAHY